MIGTNTPTRHRWLMGLWPACVMCALPGECIERPSQ